MIDARVQYWYSLKHIVLLLLVILPIFLAALFGALAASSDPVLGLAIFAISICIGLTSIVTANHHLKWRGRYSPHLAVYQLSRIGNDDLWKHLKTYPRTQIVMSPILNLMKNDLSNLNTITHLPRKRILLVGGLGYGKSTAIVHFVEWLRDIGWKRTTKRAINPKVVLVTQPQLLLDSRERIPAFAEPCIIVVDDFQDIESHRKFIELFHGYSGEDRILLIASRPDAALGERFFQGFSVYDFSSVVSDPVMHRDFLKRVAIHAADTFGIDRLPINLLDAMIDWVIDNNQPVLYVVDLMAHLRNEGKTALSMSDVLSVPPTLQALYEEHWHRIESGPSKRSLLRFLHLMDEWGYSTSLIEVASSGTVNCFDYYDSRNGAWAIPWELLEIQIRKIYNDQLGLAFPRVDYPALRTEIHLDRIDMQILGQVRQGNSSIAKVRTALHIGQQKAASKLKRMRNAGLILSTWEIYNIGLDESVIAITDDKRTAESITAWTQRLPRSIVSFDENRKLCLVTQLPSGGSFGMARALSSLSGRVTVDMLGVKIYGVWGFPTSLWDVSWQGWRTPEEGLREWFEKLNA